MNTNISDKDELTDDILTLEEKIYELRKKGLTFEAISKEVGFSESTVYKKFQCYIKEKGVEDPKKNGETLDKKVHQLRKEGLSYCEIALKLGKKTGTIYKRHKKMLKETNKKEINKPELLMKEKIYQLRKNGLTYEEIANTLNIAMHIVVRLYNEVIEEKDKIQITEIDEKIFKLRQKGLSYQQISDKLKKEGIDKDYSSVNNACKRIYKIKNLEEPKVDRAAIFKRTEESKLIDEEIYSLKNQGLSFAKISKELAKSGTKMGKQRVVQRYNRAARLTNQQLVKGIINLIVTRKATLEQIQKLAEIYGVDLEEGLEEKIKER